MLNPIAVAIPVFFVLIAIEYWVSVRRGVEVYRFNDAIADLSCGINQQVAGVFTKAFTMAAYLFLQPRIGLLTLDATDWRVWVLAFIGVDFAYYWWHRWTHEMALGWVSHVVHHQSEDYNLAVALRQSVTSSITSWPFYLPLALIGIPPVVMFTCSALNTLYQFWIHTELIGRLGPIEWVMNTPSHHRVHHGINPQYLDKNYAGVFIIWDRLFFTFEPEDEEVVYGTVKPLRSFNPWWANVAYVGDLVAKTQAAPPGRKLAVWLKGPGFDPQTGGHVEVSSITRFEQDKYDPDLPWLWKVYISTQFVPVAVALVTLLVIAPNQDWNMLGMVGAWIALSTLSWAGLFERRYWSLPLELGRNVCVVVAADSLYGPVAAGVALMWLAFSLVVVGFNWWNVVDGRL